MSINSISINDLLSFTGVLIACLAALYARWAVTESKRQNEISIHSEKLNIYKGVNLFYSKLAQYGATIPENNVWIFLESVQLSEFYFSKAVYQRLDAAFTKSLVMLSKNDEWENAKVQGSSNAKDIGSERHAIHLALRDECFSIAEVMKNSLRLDKS